jgi:biopolymer transport protein TolR
MAEINVTPFVDVMLVLLIVFIIAAPLLTVGVEVNLPKTRAGTLPQGVEGPLWITVRADGTLFLQETETEADELGAKLRAVAATGGTGRVIIRADGEVAHSRVAFVLAEAQRAGFTNVGLAQESGR